MSICIECGKETKSTFLNQNNEVVCGDCSYEAVHIKLTQLADALKIEKVKLMQKAQIAKAVDCKHEEMAFTYSFYSEGSGFVELWRCKNCVYGEVRGTDKSN